jgi:nicotinate-nucleotide pyrophosphorylase (carboxylating)
LGSEVLVVEGDARAILSAERTMLNFLMHLSGVATHTSAAVRAAKPLKVLATRKTLPGLRGLEKAAVVHGGGQTHRMDLADGILLKNNHLAVVSVSEAVARLRAREGPKSIIEVEVRSPAQAVAAASAGADALLIDNASPAVARRIVRALESAGLRAHRFVELSGGITVQNVGKYRRTGADAVSMGSITHSAPALPFHLTLRRRGNRCHSP